MAADASAFAVLGLDPGADDAEIEKAYKRLIKLHHPDRSGGDAARAAEITGAYRELRALRNVPEPLDLNNDDFRARGPRGGWLALALLFAAAGLILVLAQGPLASAVEDYAWLVKASPAPVAHSKPFARTDPLDQPLDDPAIRAATGEAMRLIGTSDEMSRASVSRDCHRSLRNRPSLSLLDRCSAFDAAVVQLQDRDPLRDQGPFSEIAVTGRIRASASALSDDPVGIDARVERIRRRVGEALAQPAAPAH